VRGLSTIVIPVAMGAHFESVDVLVPSGVREAEEGVGQEEEEEEKFNNSVRQQVSSNKAHSDQEYKDNEVRGVHIAGGLGAGASSGEEGLSGCMNTRAK